MSVPESRATPTFGRYQDPVMLGQGGMGAVYRAIDASLDRFVAIKVLTHREPKYVERFRREAQVLAKIMHPSIIQIYEIIGSDDVGGGLDPYIVMEYFEGKPLDAVLKMGPMAPAQVISILRQAADGLRRAHAQSVIHRDIKPANIMLSASSEVKILDFGIAKALDAKKDLTGQTVLGTPYYMSPEQAMGQPIDARTDLYSLGITAFHLLTGRRPFEAKSKVDVMLMQVKTQLPDLRQFVAGLDERIALIVEKMCSKQPAARFQNCQELMDGLDELPVSLGGKQADKARSGRPPPLPPPTTAQERPLQGAEVPRPELKLNKTPPRPASLSPRAATPSVPHRVAGGAQTPSRTPSGNPQPLAAQRPAGSQPLSASARAAANAASSRPPDVRRAPPAAIRKGSSKMMLGLCLGVLAGVLALSGAFFAFGRTGNKSPWRVPAKGWIYPGPPAPPMKRVQSIGSYGNCVFSTHELEKGKEDSNSVRGVFGGSDPVNGRCWFPHQVGPNRAGEIWQELWVDGVKRAQVIYDPPLANDEDQLGFEVSKQHGTRLAELSPGKHTVDLWIYRQGEDADNPEALAAGEFIVRK